MLQDIKVFLLRGFAGTFWGLAMTISCYVVVMLVTFLVALPVTYILGDTSLADRFYEFFIPSTPLKLGAVLLLFAFFTANGGARRRDNELFEEDYEERSKQTRLWMEQREAEIISGERKIGEWGPLKKRGSVATDGPTERT